MTHQNSELISAKNVIYIMHNVRKHYHMRKTKYILSLTLVALGPVS